MAMIDGLAIALILGTSGWLIWVFWVVEAWQERHRKGRV